MMITRFFSLSVVCLCMLWLIKPVKSVEIIFNTDEITVGELGDVTSNGDSSNSSINDTSSSSHVPSPDESVSLKAHGEYPRTAHLTGDLLLDGVLIQRGNSNTTFQIDLLYDMYNKLSANMTESLDALNSKLSGRIADLESEVAHQKYVMGSPTDTGAGYQWGELADVMTGGNWQECHTSDLDGDDVLDLFYALWTSNQATITIQLMNADGIAKGTPVSHTADEIATFCGVPTGQDNNRAFDLADMDGDGVLDIAVSFWKSDIVNANDGAICTIMLNSDGSLKTLGAVVSPDDINSQLVNSNWGWGVRFLPDQDGNGVDELIVTPGGDTAFHATIIYMDVDGTSLGQIRWDIDSWTGDQEFLGTWTGSAAQVTDTIDDMDGDDTVEVLFGDGSIGAGHVGSIKICFTDPTYSGCKRVANIGPAPNGATYGGWIDYGLPQMHDTSAKSGTVEAYWGAAATQVGDLNNDGIPDLFVGRYNYDPTDGDVTFTDAGGIDVICLRSDGTVKDNWLLDPVNSPEFANFNLGVDKKVGIWAVPATRDVTAPDDIHLFLVGNPGVQLVTLHQSLYQRINDLKSKTTASIQTVRNAVEGNSHVPYTWSPLDYITTGGNWQDDRSGDLDGDGVLDLFYALWAGGQATITIQLMNADHTFKGAAVSHHSTTIATFCGLPTGQDNNRRFDLSDIDGDGVLDMAVSFWKSDILNPNDGAICTIMLNPDGSLKTLGAVISPDDINSQVVNTYWSWGVRFLPDQDGNGVDELIVTPGGDTAVHATVIFLDDDGTSLSQIRWDIDSWTGDQEFLGTWTGSDLIVQGYMPDMDGDGAAEVLFGDGSIGGGHTGSIKICFTEPDYSGCKRVANIGPAGGGLTYGGWIDYGWPLMHVTGDKIGTSQDYWGATVDCVGDLDNDGIADILVGRYNYDPKDSSNVQHSDLGGLDVILLNRDGTVKRNWLLDPVNSPELAHWDETLHNNLGHSPFVPLTSKDATSPDDITLLMAGNPGVYITTLHRTIDFNSYQKTHTLHSNDVLHDPV